MTYDFNGNLLSLTDPALNATTWVYDALNRATSETNQLNDARTFEYDLSGNLTKKTDRNGRVTKYLYDDLDRLRVEQWFADDEALSPLHTLNYHYDLAGRLESAYDTVAEYDYAYDRLDQVTTLTTNLAGLADEVMFTSVYDLAGNRTKLSTTIDAVADLVNDYVYDDLDRLKQLKQHGVTPGNAVAQKRADFSYHLDGQFDQIQRYDDLAATVGVIDTTYDYDLAGRVTSVWHLKSVNLFFSHGREYDQANRAVHDTTYYSTGSPVQLDRFYNYDERGQLTSVTDGDPETPTVYEDYSYDDNGNREESDSVAWDIDPNNQLRSDGVYQYEYDAEGNRTRRIELIDDEPDGETTEYIWDHRNRLTAVITKATPAGAAIHTVIYAYDVFDRKVRRDVDETGDGTSVDSRELYVYDGADVLFDFEDEDANGGDPQVLARRYLHGPAVDQVLAQEEVGDDTDWLLADLQGSTRDIVRRNGTTTVLVEHLDYNSFGEPVIASAVTRYGYTAREYDTDTGLQYNRARWYDPATGRWISEDPIGFEAGDANLARYVENRVTTCKDPTGLVLPAPEQQEAIDRQLDWMNQYLPEWMTNSLFYSFPGPAGIGNGASGPASSFASKLIARCKCIFSPLHHIATNKNWVSTLRGGPWSPVFERIFKKAGMTLDDAANKVRIPGHYGPHPEEYHQAILDRLTQATKGLSGSAYKEALIKTLNEIAEEASTCGTYLNRLLTDG